MTTELDRRAQALLQAALEVPDEEREAYLDLICGHGELRAEVDSLLAALGEADSFLERSALEGRARVVHERLDAHALGKRVGSYVIERVIGRGGMGTVYLARGIDSEDEVALKVMRDHITASSLRRFEYEADILGRLDHPCVAKVYEAGTHDDGGGGLPYFAMEFVADARPITEYAERNDLDLDQRCRLFARVADAVHHGHQKGIVHRDIKPDNVLVDARGNPKIIDFGVARICDPDNARSRSLTQAGQLLGTLKYMSPEQLDADQKRVDIRSDVYSLGVLLYELVTGATPYDLEGLSLLQSAHVIRDVAPRRPCQVAPGLPDDVEAILLAALEKDPQRRYASAAEFALDVRRHVASEPVGARPPSLMTQLVLLGKRHRTAFATGFVVLGVLVLAAVISSSLAVYARREARQARWESYVGHVLAADSALLNGEYERLRAELARAPAEHRGWEWSYLDGASQASRVVARHGAHVWAVRASPDGTLVATAGNDGKVRLLDAFDGDVVNTLEHPDYVYDVAFGPGGDVLASASRDGIVRLWEVEGARLIRALPQHGDRVYGVAFRPDGEVIAAAVWDGTIHVWDVASATRIRRLDVGEGGVREVAFHPDGRRLASASEDGVIRLWDADSGELLHALTETGPEMLAVAFDATGERLAGGGATEVVHVWRVADGSELHAFPADAPVWDVQFAPDEETILAGLSHRSVQRWNIASGRELEPLHGHEELVSSLTFALPEATRLVSGSWDGTVRVWALEQADRLRRLTGHTDLVRSVAFSPDDRLIASGSWDGTFRLWSALGGDELVARDLGSPVNAVIFHPLEPRVLAAGFDGPVRSWSTHTGLELTDRALPGLAEETHSLALTPNGECLVVGGSLGTLQIRATGSGELLAEISEARTDSNVLAISPDGGLLAVGGEDFSIRLIGLPAGEQRGVLIGHTALVCGLAFGTDGRTLVSGARDRTLRFWDVERGVERQELRGKGEFFTHVDLHPDGGRVAVGSWFDTVKIWSTSGAELVTLRGHTGSVRCVAFSADGRRLVSASADGTLRLWDDRTNALRWAESERARRLRSEARPRVGRMLEEASDPEAVAAALRADTALAGPLRHAALEALLIEAVR